MKETITQDSFEYSNAEATEQETETQKTETQETQQEEQKTEETEQTQETETEEQKTQETETQEVDYIKALNEKHGTEFKSEEEIKEFLEIKKQVELLKKERDENREWKEKFTKLQEGFDPKKIFVNEEIRRVNELLKKFPNIDPNVANKVVDMDLNKASDLDVVVLGKQLNVRGFRGGDMAAKAQIAKQLDIDIEDLSDVTALDDIVLNQISEEAGKYRKQFAEMQSVQLPDYSDLGSTHEKLEEEKTQAEKTRTEAWNKVLDGILNDFKEYELFDKDKEGKPVKIHSYTVDAEFRTKERDFILNNVVKSGLEPNEENFKKVRTYIETVFGDLYRTAILKDYGDSIATKIKDGVYEESHVPPKPKEETPIIEKTLEGAKNDEVAEILAPKGKRGKSIFS